MAIEVLYSNAVQSIQVEVDSATKSSSLEVGSDSSVSLSAYSGGSNPVPIAVSYSSLSPLDVKVSGGAESTIGISTSGIISLGLNVVNNSSSYLDDSTLTLPNLYIAPNSGLIPGDLVYLQITNDSLYSEYGVQLLKVNTNNTGSGATSALFILKSTTEEKTVLMSKGVYDYDNNDFRVISWISGYTLYANSFGLSIAPSGFSGHWVKSLGYCVPNNINKKRVWFNPDSTYIQRT